MRFISFGALGKFLEKNKNNKSAQLFEHPPLKVKTYGRYTQEELGDTVVVDNRGV